VRDASPLWTLQRLCFEPDVAADFSDRGENRDLGTATEAIKIQLTREMRLENGPPCKVFLQCFDQIACAHMSGLFVRSHMNAGQDGFRDKSSTQNVDLIEGHWKMRIVSRRGSIDHTICSSSCKFWHQLSTVAVELLPVSG
jgi:hypothetical protein